MSKVITQRDACLSGKSYCSCLMDAVERVEPHTQKPQFGEVLTLVKKSYPHAPIPGIPDSHVAMVYNIKHRAWFCAGLIRAFATRLEATYASVRFVGIYEPDPEYKTSRKPKPFVQGEALLHQRVSDLIADDSIHLVCAVINFNNSHWACVIVDRVAKDISIYDSFGCSSRFERLAWVLAKKLGVLYGVTSVNTPRQVDGHSCGILACYKIWQRSDPRTPKVMEFHAMPRRQFEFLLFVMTGTIVVEP
jgi:hypothetical protein